MAAFAVQAITQVITRISLWRLTSRQAALGVNTTTAKNDEPAVAHAEYVERFSRRWDDTTIAGGTSRRTEEELERLVRETIKQGAEIEAHARRLLINHLPNGSKAQVLLKADRNIQMRDVKSIRERSAHPARDREVRAAIEGGGRLEDPFGDNVTEVVSKPLSEEETLDEVNMFREAWASFLVAGSRLRGLDGQARCLMERRREDRVGGGEGKHKDRSERERAEAEEDTL